MLYNYAMKIKHNFFKVIVKIWILTPDNFVEGERVDNGAVQEC